MQHGLVGVGEVEADVLEAQVTAGAARARGSPPVIADLVSKISLTRSAAVIASWAIARITPRAAMGQTRDSISVMKATSVPSVTSPSPTACAPSSRTMTRLTLGMISRNVQNFDDSRTFSIEVS